MILLSAKKESNILSPPRPQGSFKLKRLPALVRPPEEPTTYLCHVCEMQVRCRKCKRRRDDEEERKREEEWRTLGRDEISKEY